MKQHWFGTHHWYLPLRPPPVRGRNAKLKSPPIPLGAFNAIRGIRHPNGPPHSAQRYFQSPGLKIKTAYASTPFQPPPSSSSSVAGTRGHILILWRAGVRAWECARGTSRHWGLWCAPCVGLKPHARPSENRANSGGRGAGLCTRNALRALSLLTLVGLCGLRVSQTSPPAAFGGMGLGRGSRTGELASEAARTADRCARAWPGVKRLFIISSVIG